MSRKNSLTRRVRQAYCQDALTRICTMPETDFGRAYNMTTTEVDQYGWAPKYGWTPKIAARPAAPDFYHFRDNGGRVLAVAHLDTVMPGNRRTPRYTATPKGPRITSGALDDRLGAYVILDLLPKMGVTCDWLLTTGEEQGQSTAGFFTPGKDYDHVIEFDRGGTDVVMYQYEDKASRRLVEAAGAVMGHGSFSDIASLEQLGVKAFNWGVGYRGNYHSEQGYAYLSDTFAMVARYLRFHEQNAGTPMPHDPGYDAYGGPQGWQNWQDDKSSYFDDCVSCGSMSTVDSVTGYCTACGCCDDCGGTSPDIAAEWADASQDPDDMDVCQCYTPSRRQTSLKAVMDDADRFLHAYAGRDESRTAAAPARTNYTGMTWAEYLAQRPALEGAQAPAARTRDAAYEEELDAALAAAIERDGDPEPVRERKERGMWQHEIQDAVRLAVSGRWTIRARSPRSAITELTVDAAAVKRQVHRIQFTEGYQILAVTQAADTEAPVPGLVSQESADAYLAAAE